jgi:dCTP deaminase
MTVLSDSSLHRRIRTGSLGVSPFEAAALQPASIDLTLGDRLLVMEFGGIIDPEQDQTGLWRELDLRTDGRWFVGGMRLHLGVTAQLVRIPDDCLGILSGVSTLGRQGIQVHVTAGLIDPGFCGNLTLELIVFGQAALLRPGQRVAQLTLFQLDRTAERPYRGRYQGDDDAQPAKGVVA